MFYIYGLYVGDYVYVGCTEDPTARQVWHIKHLKKGTHYNKILQNHYDNNSRFEIFEETDKPRKRENDWILALKSKGLKLANLKDSTYVNLVKKKKVGQFCPTLVTWRSKKKPIA